jgi:TRAP-type mannitol/chloroaromatic compound transport system permease large subunit
MEWAGLAMLALVVALLVLSGLPAFVVLIGVSVAFAMAGIAAGTFSYSLLTALPARILGLLETDILQALPLYVLMGALLDRLPLAETLFRAGGAALSRSRAAALLSAIGVGVMLAPMNGSVGASTATLSRVLYPRLRARGAAPAASLSLVCVTSTLGVVVPPSLVLILLGDTMLRAHTEAVNATGILTRVVNTQDVFRGALVPAGLFVLACLAIAWCAGRRGGGLTARGARLGAGGWFVAIITPLFIIGLLGAVTAGYLYAVEAAATGALVLFLSGVLSGHLRGAALAAVLRDTMAVTGALFALFVAATTFTLVFRAFGSDRLLAALIGRVPGDATAITLATLLLIGLCAFVLDAFEIILVIIPVVMPPVLFRVPDAVWLAVLALLVLQTSFLIPPFGYGVMMARNRVAEHVRLRDLALGLAPYLCAQLLVLAATLALPQLTHVFDSPGESARLLTPDEVRRQLEAIAPRD